MTASVMGWWMMGSSLFTTVTSELLPLFLLSLPSVSSKAWLLLLALVSSFPYVLTKLWHQGFLALVSLPSFTQMIWLLNFEMALVYSVSELVFLTLMVRFVSEVGVLTLVTSLSPITTLVVSSFLWDLKHVELFSVVSLVTGMIETSAELHQVSLGKLSAVVLPFTVVFFLLEVVLLFAEVLFLLTVVLSWTLLVISELLHNLWEVWNLSSFFVVVMILDDVMHFPGLVMHVSKDGKQEDSLKDVALQGTLCKA